MEEKDMKKAYAEKYFNDVKPKHLKHFKTKTPQGNIIEGFICKKRNRLLGSMLIDNITDKNNVVHSHVQQFIHAMPKINYYSYKNEMYYDEDVIWPCFEKLDGSCLILFGIYDSDGNLLEVIPKTRGVPIADSHIREMYNQIDHSNIEEFFKQNKHLNPTLMFELYGQLNKHSIYYPEVRISMALIGASFEGKLTDHVNRMYLSQQYDFNLPKILFKLKYSRGFWRIMIPAGVHSHYLIKNMTDAQKEGLMVEYPTQLDAINTVKEYLDIINDNYSEVHGYSLTEGVCVNTYDSTGNHFMYLKIKPSKIEEKAKAQEGVPRLSVLKEVQKYFDEYGSQAKDLYKEDPEHYYKYVVDGLLEEFDKELVNHKRTKSRIKNVFLDMLEAKEPPVGIQEICNKLVEDYPDQEVVDYMRLFAQEYPEKKRQARLAFPVFERLVLRRKNNE